MHGLSAMNYDYATAMNEHMADVIGQITRAIILAQSKADPDEYPDIKKTLGLLIGSIEMDILWPIYRKFPELDSINTTPSPTLK